MINAIYPYNPGSESARLLAEALDVPRIKHRGSRFRGSQLKTVINWGAAEVPLAVAQCRMLNNIPAVNIARCKLRTFNRFRTANQHEQFQIRYPEFTTDLQVALGWLREGTSVCVRHTTTGHEGAGLEVLQGGLNARQYITERELPDFLERVRRLHPQAAQVRWHKGKWEGLQNLGMELPVLVSLAPLYTKYIKKKEEYRVHVIGQTTYTQRKLRRKDAEGDRQIRNTANGYVFSGRFEPPADVVTQAVAAVQAIGLDFAAVDVVWNDHYKQAWVLELNTAPGIEGRTVEVYRDALRELVG